MIKVRQMSAVLLRRIFSSSVDFYDKLDQAFQQEMKNDLLKAINEEQAQAVRKKVCDAVAELSRSLLGKLWRYLLFYRNLIIQISSRKGLFKNRCGLHICVYQKSHFF